MFILGCLLILKLVLKLLIFVSYMEITLALSYDSRKRGTTLNNLWVSSGYHVDTR